MAFEKESFKTAAGISLIGKTNLGYCYLFKSDISELFLFHGRMPERLNGADCKSVIIFGLGGSNPPPSTIGVRCIMVIAIVSCIADRAKHIIAG